MLDMRYKKLMNSPLAALIIWAAFLIIFMILGTKNPWSWVCLIVSFIAGIWQMRLSNQKNKQAQASWSAWDKRLRSLVEASQIDELDDGHLFEWFDRQEWERIFSELERDQPGKRNFRKAIDSVDPTLLKKTL